MSFRNGLTHYSHGTPLFTVERKKSTSTPRWFGCRILCYTIGICAFQLISIIPRDVEVNYNWLLDYSQHSYQFQGSLIYAVVAERSFILSISSNLLLRLRKSSPKLQRYTDIIIACGAKTRAFYLQELRTKKNRSVNY